MTGNPGPGHVWKDAGGVVIDGSFWLQDTLESHGLDMGLVDGSGNFWRVDRVGGAVDSYLSLLVDIPVEYAITGCSGPSYYSVQELPPPHVTFITNHNLIPGTIPEGTTGTSVVMQSVYVRGICSDTTFTDSHALLTATVSSLPSVNPPNLSSHPTPYFPAID